MGRVGKWWLCAGWALHLFWVVVDIAMRLHFRLKGTCLLPLLAVQPKWCTPTLIPIRNQLQCSRIVEAAVVAVYKQDYPAFASCSAAALLQHCKVKQCREWVHWDLLVVRGDSCWVLLVRHRATLALSRTGGISFYVSTDSAARSWNVSLFLLLVSMLRSLSLSRFSVRLHLQF